MSLSAVSLSAEGLALIRQWEGCRLEAYPDPATGGAPWTIGYGHTGPAVTPGLRISQDQAEHWLQDDLAIAEAAVNRLIVAPAGLTSRQREALVSFCFNVGEGALAASTLRRRLAAGEGAATVLAEELPRWCQGPKGPIEGLRRRRAAELAHALGQGPPSPAPKPVGQAPGVGAAGPGLIQLAVPYFSQNDSRSDQGARMCFSSSCAMAAAFLRPGCLAGPGQADDRYLALVQRYGDTTDAQAQVQALASLGLQARLRQDGRLEHLQQQLQRGIPVPVGWLHRGPVSAPQGNGHWSLVIGWDPQRQQLLMHDPNGEADLVHGGYGSNGVEQGRAQRYSSRNWGPRWMVEGSGSGWWLELQHP